MADLRRTRRRMRTALTPGHPSLAGPLRQFEASTCAGPAVLTEITGPDGEAEWEVETRFDGHIKVRYFGARTRQQALRRLDALASACVPTASQPAGHEPLESSSLR